MPNSRRWMEGARGVATTSVASSVAKPSLDDSSTHKGKNVEDCQGYCTRAARRLEKARAAAVAAQETVIKFNAKRLQKLEELKTAAAPPIRHPVDSYPFCQTMWRR